MKIENKILSGGTPTQESGDRRFMIFVSSRRHTLYKCVIGPANHGSLKLCVFPTVKHYHTGTGVKTKIRHLIYSTLHPHFAFCLRIIEPFDYIHAEII